MAPFSGSRGSGTVSRVVKFFRLSVERCMLIWVIPVKGLCQLTRIFPVPRAVAEKRGRVSCAPAAIAKKKKRHKTPAVLGIEGITNLLKRCFTPLQNPGLKCHFL